MKSEPQQNGVKRGNEHLVVLGRQDHAIGRGRWYMGLHELRDCSGTTDGERALVGHLQRVQMVFATCEH
jgi:hypothetical protein